MSVSRFSRIYEQTRAQVLAADEAALAAPMPKDRRSRQRRSAALRSAINTYSRKPRRRRGRLRRLAQP